jgi:pimeloyl-ACP methyl ester carboxylesterase
MAQQEDLGMLNHCISRRNASLALLGALAGVARAQTDAVAPSRIGVVLLHGKGGQPTGLVAALAAYLQAQGFPVRNLEMPWSGRRQYDASPQQAQQQVTEAFAEMRSRGVPHQVLIGHSQGAIFALHLAALLPLDAVVAIAPGGNTGAELYAQKLGGHLAAAQALVNAGRGQEVADFADYEGSKGLSTVRTRADWFVDWFDPQGVMQQERALRAVPPTVPVLYLAPTGDYPALQRANPALYALLPKHPLTRWEQPAASHAQVPTVARERIGQWIVETLQAPR